jgi:hypothetical protein
MTRQPFVAYLAHQEVLASLTLGHGMGQDLGNNEMCIAVTASVAVMSLVVKGDGGLILARPACCCDEDAQIAAQQRRFAMRN